MIRVHRPRTAGSFALLAGILLSTPAYAQVDFSGEWAQLRHEDSSTNPEVGDYVGIPLNAAGRARADAVNVGVWSLPEWQCRPHAATFFWRGTGETRITKVVDPVTRDITAFRVERRRNFDQLIYLDGRPHPPEYAAHTWGGFSTGTWEGDMLTIRTTHIKEGYLRMNGVPSSDRTTITERWIRHGDLLFVVQAISDPVYLEEPFVVSGQFRLDLRQRMQITPCVVVDESPADKGVVPHFLPWANQYRTEFVDRYGLPAEALNDGAKTMYPEYQAKLKNSGAEPVGSSAPLPVAQNQPPANSEIHVLPVRGNIYMIVGEGSNITASIGADGALIVDSGSGAKADKVVAAVSQLLTASGASPAPVQACLGCAGLASPYVNAITASPGAAKPIRYVINTSAHPDHVGGNLTTVKAGRTITGGDIVLEILGEAATQVATVFAHENVLIRMSASGGNRAAVPADARPSEVYSRDSYKFSQFFNGEGIQIFHQPAAITDGDSIVYFRYSDVISTGDLFVTSSYPMIDVEKGGTIQGVIDGLNRILDLAVPESRAQGGTMIIPGHGRLCDVADVAYYRDMVTVIRDRVQDLMKKGMTLAQVKAARPTLDYDPRYATVSWTGDMFVEAVFRSLGRGRP